MSHDGHDGSLTDGVDKCSIFLRMLDLIGRRNEKRPYWSSMNKWAISWRVQGRERETDRARGERA